jgi:RNA polymerase sigma-70 factor (ECF subfamily)
MLGLPQPVIATEEPPQPSVTDALLVARAQSDPAAVAPLYTLYFDPVYRYCYHRLGSWEAAEDATSIVFTNVLAALPRYRSDGRPGAFRSWLFTIAHNVVINQVHADRRRRVQPLDDAGQVADRAPSLEETAMAADASRMVREVLAQLSPDQRQVVELRLAGLTNAEIGHVLGRRSGAIRITQYRAGLRIRALLAAEREEGLDA